MREEEVADYYSHYFTPSRLRVRSQMSCLTQRREGAKEYGEKGGSSSIFGVPGGSLFKF